MTEAGPVAASNVEDEGTCRACGGECCRIYLDYPPEAGLRDLGMRVSGWAGDFIGSWAMLDDGARGLPDPELPAPSFDPWAAHVDGTPEERAAYRASLPEGTDPECCAYLGDDGCRLPRERRPAICLSFTCDRLAEALSARDAS